MEFLASITQLILNILGYLLLDTSRIVIALFVVINVVGVFKKCLI